MFSNKIFQFWLAWIMVLNISIVWAQDTDQSSGSGEQDAAQGETTEEVSQVDKEGAVKISNVLVNSFEDADRWYGAMSIDGGLIQVQKRRGAPREVRDASPDQSSFVLGAKINFFKRGYHEASIEPPAPIIIPGYTRKVSVWVYGQGSKHKLLAVVRDFKGRVFKFNFGELSFYGWKKLQVDIPNDPSWPFFSQIDDSRRRFYQTHGVTFIGFLLEFNPKETKNRFYVYLDNFEAESNVHLYEKELEITKVPEDERLDPVDDW